MYELPPSLLGLYSKSQNEIRARLRDFALVPPEGYFYEMAYCILTPQSKAEGADKAIRELEERDFFNRPFDSSAILRKYVRFHNTKSERLIAIAGLYPEVAEMLALGHRPEDERVWLLARINGFGMKEASHFLRNIGRRGLAILDRHILNHLAERGVIGPDTNITTTNRYLEVENKFKQFAGAVGIDLDELDLLFWSANTGVIRK